MEDVLEVLPETSDVLRIIGKSGVIVGSWPYMDELAKDLDVVIKPRGNEESRNKIFDNLMKSFSCNFCESSFIGHLYIRAYPMNVEIFESDFNRISNDAEKNKNRLSFYQAKKKSVVMNAYGIEMRAVVI